jgi:hypothetical protein
LGAIQTLPVRLAHTIDTRLSYVRIQRTFAARSWCMQNQFRDLQRQRSEKELYKYKLLS